MKDLYIIGASGFGRELLQWIKDINCIKNTWNVVGFLDDNLNALDGYDCDISVVGTIEDWVPQNGQFFVIAIANPQIKERIVKDYLLKGAEFVSIIHPTAIIGEFNKIGKGTVVYPYAKITVNTVIGDFVSVLGSNIGHDAIVGDFSTICGLCAINGHANIGKRVFIGSHSVIAPSKIVADDAYVGNGSVVIRNVRANTRVFGNPAKVIDL